MDSTKQKPKRRFIESIIYIKFCDKYFFEFQSNDPKLDNDCRNCKNRKLNQRGCCDSGYIPTLVEVGFVATPEVSVPCGREPQAYNNSFATMCDRFEEVENPTLYPLHYCVKYKKQCYYSDFWQTYYAQVDSSTGEFYNKTIDEDGYRRWKSGTGDNGNPHGWHKWN
jgi:hypothetical protein